MINSALEIKPTSVEDTLNLLEKSSNLDQERNDPIFEMHCSEIEDVVASRSLDLDRETSDSISDSDSDGEDSLKNEIVFGDHISNHTPLRLNGGGDNSIDRESCVHLEQQGNDLQNSISEQDIRDVLFDAGYTIETINDVLAAKVHANSRNPIQ